MSNEDEKSKIVRRLLTAMKVLGVLLALGGGVPAILSSVGLMLSIMFIAFPWIAPGLQVDATKSFLTTVIGSTIGVFGVMLALAAWRMDQPEGSEDK